MTFIKHLFRKFKTIILYGAAMAIMVFGLKWLQWKFLIVDNSLEIYVGLIALFFTTLGIWVATQLTRPKIQTITIEKEVYRNLSEDFSINEVALEQLKLSNREYEVLQLITQGYTNAEIADKLFVSLSTIKTHVSNLFTKMEVKTGLRQSKKLTG